ncbi:MAG: LptF/LptG family permease [Phycisphaera sp.]|nr:LptF/LptG family permease [Phycisphaera sp.]
MRTLDRYIIRQFLINFVILTVALLLVFIVVDVVIDLDEFLEAGQEQATAHNGSVVLWTAWALVDWYTPVICFVYSYLCGLITVAAMGFTFSSLSRSRELTAMASGGISLYRVALPVIVVGGVLNLMALPDQELLIPTMAQKLARQKSEVGKETTQNFSFYYVPDDRGQLFSAAAFDVRSRSLSGVTILQRDKEGKLIQHITASSATWDESNQRWVLAGGDSVKPLASAATSSPSQGIPVAEYVATNLTPDRLLAKRAVIYPMFLSVAQLREMATIARDSRAESSKFLRIIHSRFSLIVVNLLILMLGLPFFVRCTTSNMLTDTVAAAGVCIGAWFMALVMSITVGSVLNPVAMAWLPVVILLPVSTAWLMRLRT